MKLFPFCALAGVLALLLIFAAVPSTPSAKAQVPAPVLEPIYTPDSSVKFALADLATIDPEFQPYIRYLSLYNVPKIHRQAVGETVSFVINSLSRRKQIYIPVFTGGSDQTVIRLNLKDYDIDPAQFDKLGKEGSGVRPFPDPYFHYLLQKGDVRKTKKQKVQKEVEKEVEKTVNKKKLVFSGYYDQFRQPIYREEIVKEVVKEVVKQTIEVEEDVADGFEKKVVFAQAPWLDPVAIAQLTAATNSEVPILRADWFVVNATLPPAYYNFLELGNKEADFQKLVFADVKLAEKARSQFKAVAVTSVVARNNRTLTRSPTFTDGYYWESHDSLKSIDDRNYLLNFLNEKFDAKEIIGTLPNGLQAYFVTDGAGNRVDFADPNVATDYTSVDRIVRTGRSCMICHSEGIKPIEDNVRLLNRKLQNLESIKLLITDEKQAYQVFDLFGSDLDKKIVKDQQLFADAVGLTNGLEANANGKQLGLIWDAYQEILLTKEIVAREAAVTPDELEVFIRLSNDPVILGMVKLPIRPVRRDQFEQSFGNFMLLIQAARVTGAKPGPLPQIGTPVPLISPVTLHPKK
jgi:hypothetical protein